MIKVFQITIFLFALVASNCYAGSQVEEPLSNSVKAMMQRSISDKAAPRLAFGTPEEGAAWLSEMSKRLEKRIPDAAYREDFLRTVHYEATRAGLDPQMVLAVSYTHLKNLAKLTTV